MGTPSKPASFKTAAEQYHRDIERAREEGFRDGQQDALRKVLSKLEEKLIGTTEGVGPRYDTILEMVRWIAGLRNMLTGA